MKLLGPVIRVRDCMDYNPQQKKFLSLCDNVVECAEDADVTELNAG